MKCEITGIVTDQGFKRKTTAMREQAMVRIEKKKKGKTDRKSDTEH